MKYRTIRFLCLTLALATLAVPFLGACRTDPDDKKTDTETGADTIPTDAPAETPTEEPTEAPTEPETEAETLGWEDYVYGNDLTVTPVVTKTQPVDHITLMGRALSDFTIVMPDNPQTRESDAAYTLQEKFKAAVGIELPVVKASEGSGDWEIVVGTTDRDTDAVRTARSSLSHEGYLLHTEGNRLYISGLEARTTYNGVLSFLEDYVGCRFFAPDCQIIHEAGEIAIPDGLDVVFDPTLQFRCSYYQFVDGNYERYYKLRPLVYTGGRVHTLQALAEMQNYTTGQQPCLTDPAVYETVLKNVRSALSRNPDATVISVSQNDSYEEQLGCQCENCKALNQKYGCEGGALFEFVNRIARDIKDDYPNVMVETLAYRYSIVPPKDMVFEDNVMVMLCTMELCVNHTIDDPDCPANYRYAEYLEAWSKICSHISIWDYHTTFRDYQIPFPIEEMLYDQIVYYANHNTISLFSEGNYNSRSGQFEEMRSYVCSRLMWNTDETKEQYLADIDDFLKYYYGDGWIYIRRYMDIIRDLSMADGRHYNLWATYSDAVPFDRRINDDKVRAEGSLELFAKAEAAAATDEQKARIRKASIQAWWYAANTLRKKQYQTTYKELMTEFGIRLQNEVTPFNG